MDDGEDSHCLTLMFTAILLLVSQSVRDTMGKRAVYCFLISFMFVYYVFGDRVGGTRTDKFLGSLFFGTFLAGVVIIV